MDNDGIDDDLGELLRKHYKPKFEIDPEIFWNEVSKKIDSLFHKEIFSDRTVTSDGRLLTDEEKYWNGLDEYIRNEIGSLRHKSITEHLLACRECRKNYNDLLDKKKTTPIKMSVSI